MSAGITVVYGLSLLLYAAFFGMAVYLFVAPCHAKLSGPTFIECFQRINPYLKVRVRVLSLATVALILVLLGLLFDRWAGPPFWLTLAALLGAAMSVAVDLVGSAPLARQMGSWSPAEPPAGWEQVRDRWLRLQSFRGAVSAVGFVLLLSATLIDRPAGNFREPSNTSPGEAAAREPAPRHCEATIYLPLANNEGRAFPDAEWQEALHGLVVPFGGATLGQPQEGCWLDARRQVRCERIRPVVVSFAPERLDEFRVAVHNVGKRLGQEAVYVRFEEPRVELIPMSPAPGGP
jgi:hypothetical protein